MAEYDHYGSEIPPQRHSRAEIHQMMRGHTAIPMERKRVHPREYEPAWESADVALSLEEQVGFDLESIQKMRTDDSF